MKKILLVSIFLMITVFSMPVFVIKYQAEEDNFNFSESIDANIDGHSEKTALSYDKRTIIKLLCGDEIKEISLYEYLKGVLCAEMPASFPEEALKAQAVAARTYTLYKRNIGALTTVNAHPDADVCDNPSHCKAYRDFFECSAVWIDSGREQYAEAVENAVRDTDGQVLEYNNNPIAAVFHAVSVGRTENAADVWGTSTPYLLSVESPGAEDDPYCYADVSFTLDEFRSIFCGKYPDADLSGAPNTWFKASVRGEGGGIISVEVGGTRVSGSAIRAMFGLNSTNFTVSSDDAEFVFHTSGRGHGVGLSQYGARKLALDGAKYNNILAHYYPQTFLADYSKR